MIALMDHDMIAFMGHDMIALMDHDVIAFMDHDGQRQRRPIGTSGLNDFADLACQIGHREGLGDDSHAGG